MSKLEMDLIKKNANTHDWVVAISVATSIFVGLSLSVLSQCRYI